jgi:hypothetical protein
MQKRGKLFVRHLTAFPGNMSAPSRIIFLFKVVVVVHDELCLGLLDETKKRSEARLKCHQSTDFAAEQKLLLLPCSVNPL